MPAFTPKGGYNLTITQVDLILYALNAIEMNDAEDNERRKIAEEFYNASDNTEPNYNEDPYANYCDI
jgi:hypothetical protein